MTGKRMADKVAVVTGAGSGIGQATALRFAEEGAWVAALDIALDSALATAARIESGGGKALGGRVDVSDSASVAAAIGKVLQAWGRIDVLINNAGVTRDGYITKLSDEQWDQVVDVSLKGTFLCCRAVAPGMYERKQGRIVNTASVSVRGNIGQTNYSAAKAGVIGLTRSLALEAAKFGVTVNCVAPGATDTPILKTIPAPVMARMLESIPLKCLADPRDIANAHLFLASEEGRYVTGQVLVVDGGQSIGLM